MKEIRKALLFIAGFILLVPNALAQSPAASEPEPNRITGVKFEAIYNADKTAATYHVTNVSNKIIKTVRVTAIREGNPPHRSITERDLNRGESMTEKIALPGPMTVFLDAIIYADGSMETRNDAVAAMVEREEKGRSEYEEQWKAAVKAFAAVNPDIAMSQEEQMVRKCYAKASFETEIAVLGEFVSRRIPATSEEASKLLESRIRFVLSDFKVGDFAEIESRPWAEVVPDETNVFHFLYAGSLIQKDGHGNFLRWLKVTWENPADTKKHVDVEEAHKDEPESAGAKTVKDVIKRDSWEFYKGESGKPDRYAAFTVKATLDGRTVTYRSLFVFANHGERVAGFDPALHLPVEMLIATAPYPQVLVESAYRELPLVKTWIAKNELSGCKKLDGPEICCDAVTGRCGLPREDLARSLNVPISDKDRAMVMTFLESGPAAGKPEDVRAASTDDMGKKQ